MSKQTTNRLLFIFLLSGVLLFTFATGTLRSAKEPVCDDPAPAKFKNPRTGLLWESLSHQFLTAVQQ